MRTNNNNLVDFSSKQTYVASESLLQKAKDKHSDIYLNFAYTDYGGSFLDKVIISYFKEYYPENIVHEKISWNGENAFIFGEPAKELHDLIKTGYILGFDCLGQYCTEMEYNVITEEAQRYINDNGLDNELYDIVCEWLIENSHIEPNFLDYSETDLNEYLQKNGYLKQ
jgi:hypothetical protein